ncbi:complement C1q tumor necrosis factor-related protein 1-like [Ptychodera flava]|uniref:complement C1q tumor necrosis factor-related protein 1-like n=1 Tax=Ptychodera flava TaxID=63121 RepID=UPI00396A26C9
MMARIFLVLFYVAYSVLGPAVGSAASASCTRCCDYLPSSTPDVFSIMRGEKGDLGQKGDAGETGEKGDSGPMGYVGPKGFKGQKGEKGIDGFVSSKGEKGNAGNKGEKGELGRMVEWSVFSVARSSAVRGSEVYQTVSFDHVFTNIGRNMNPETGIFTCSISGVYAFAFTTLKDNDNFVAAYLMLNDRPQVRIYADDSDWDGLVSQSVYLQLKTGDMVWIRVDRFMDYEHVMLDSSERCHMTFNGHLIYPTEQFIFEDDALPIN